MAEIVYNDHNVFSEHNPLQATRPDDDALRNYHSISGAYQEEFCNLLGVDEKIYNSLRDDLKKRDLLKSFEVYFLK